MITENNLIWEASKSKIWFIENTNNGGICSMPSQRCN